MKLMKDQFITPSLSMVKGQRQFIDVLPLSELQLLQAMTHAFQIVHGGRYKVRNHSKSD